MSRILNMGIIGCGDFLQWMEEPIKESKHIKTKSLFDLDRKKAEDYAAKLGGEVVSSSDDILNDPEIEVVALFVPPFVRAGLVKKCCEKGKHILATKPMGAQIADSEEMVGMIDDAGVKCGVIYRRTGDAFIETCKRVFDSGEIGNLAIYKQDWMHHYPQWNDWATDPEKNGGPFMDAMVHNLNIARYLMPGKANKTTFFSQNHTQKLKCNDTEFMKVEFEGGGSAYLFITWAANLEVFSKEGNYREHIDINYMISDKGFRIFERNEGDTTFVVASKEGKEITWEVKPLENTMFDEFALSVINNTPMSADIVDHITAYEDIKILRLAEKSNARQITLELSR